MLNVSRGGGRYFLVLVSSVTFRVRESEFREKGGDVATVATHVAEVNRFAESCRRNVVSQQVQVWFAEMLRRNTNVDHGVTIHDKANRRTSTNCQDVLTGSS